MMQPLPHCLNQTEPRGFTFVELLVGVVILTAAIAGPFFAVQQALRTSYIARDELTASALAQEGIEYVRWVRDSNYHYNRVVNPATDRPLYYGMNGTNGPNCFTSACTVDPRATINPVVSCGGATCSSRLYLSTQGLYNQASSGSATKFVRSVRLTQLNANEVRITVTVTWRTYTPETLTVHDTLTNWL